MFIRMMNDFILGTHQGFCLGEVEEENSFFAVYCNHNLKGRDTPIVPHPSQSGLIDPGLFGCLFAAVFKCVFITVP